MKKKPTKEDSTKSTREKEGPDLPTNPRKRRKVLLAQAKHLKKEGRRLLKKFGKRISDGSRTEVEEALENLETCMKAVKEAAKSPAPSTPETKTEDGTKPLPKPSDPTEVHKVDPLDALATSVEKTDTVLEERVGFGRKTVMREYLESIGYAVLVALLIRTFAMEAFQIPSGSMLPTLGIGDHIFVNKLAYGLRIPDELIGKIKFLGGLRIPIPFVGTEEECDVCWTTKGNRKRTHLRLPRFFTSVPEPGDVIVFVCPDEKSDGVDYIKRVVATPGQTIRLIQNRLEINGKMVPSKIRKRLAACNMSENENAPYYCTCTVQEETLAEEPHLTAHFAQKRYLVSPKDTLASVASRFGVSASTLFALNQEQAPLLPFSSAEEAHLPLKTLGFADYSLLESTERPPDMYKLKLPSEHLVRAGETFSQLAEKHGTSPWDLCAINLHILQVLPSKEKYLKRADPSERPGCLTMEALEEYDGANPYNIPLPDGITLALIRQSNRCTPLSDWPLSRCDATRPPACFGAKNRRNAVHFPVVKIPDEHVLTFGDNRDNSEDGRYWGLVPLDNIKGRASFRWWATDLSTLGFLPQLAEKE